MDELDISGKRFISSKRAAKENKYHVDYIGQLIRGGKIIGSKVGRTWYVEAESLAAYLGKEYKAPTNEIEAAPFVPTAIAEESKKEKEEEEAPIEIKIHHQPYQPFHELPQSQAVEKVLNNNVEIKKEIFKEEPHVPFSALTYLSDDEPLMLARKPTHIEAKKPTEYSHPIVKSAPRTFDKDSATLKPASRKGFALASFILAAVGLIVFASALGASYLLSYTNTIQGAQDTASVSLGK